MIESLKQIHKYDIICKIKTLKKMVILLIVIFTAFLFLFPIKAFAVTVNIENNNVVIEDNKDGSFFVTHEIEFGTLAYNKFQYPILGDYGQRLISNDTGEEIQIKGKVTDIVSNTTVQTEIDSEGRFVIYAKANSGDKISVRYKYDVDLDLSKYSGTLVFSSAGYCDR